MSLNWNLSRPPQACPQAYLEDQLADAPPERPVYLLGEGFGAVLALGVALETRSGVS